MEARELEELVPIVFLDIALIVVVARLMGALFRRIRQPAVVAEILAALILGPSLLGTFPGNPTEFLFPLDARPYLTVIAALGLIIFMFIVGLELDLGLIEGKARTAAAISICSVALPFTLGSLLAVWLHRHHGVVDGERVELLPFALFIGAAMSVTAFPVLARILAERGMQRTRTGVLALACAAVDDVLAWTILAVVLAVVRASGPADFVIMVVESVVFVATMFWMVRPRLRTLVRRRDAAGRLTPDIFAVVLVGILFSSFITDQIGIHSIFGAFLFGAIMPRDGAQQLSHEILERVEQVTVLLFLPVFFVATGLKVDITALGSFGLAELGAVLAVACLGKFLGAALAARAVGVPPRQATAVGILMNTRGLTELVVLTIGSASGVLDAQLFSVMVVMAIVTTAMTEPLLRLVYTDRMVARDIAQAQREALGLSAQYRVLVVVEEPHGPLEADTAVALLGDEPSSEVLISRFDRPHGRLEVGSGLTSELAAVAETFESLQQLARRMRANGASVTVHSRPSEDLVEDVVALIRASDADVLIVAMKDGDPRAKQLMEKADCAVVIVREPEGDHDFNLLAEVDRVVAVPGKSNDGLAAVEQAWRAATRTGAALALVETEEHRGQRRAAALHRKLADTRIKLDPAPVALAEEQSGGILFIVGWSEWRRAGVQSELRQLAQRCDATLVVRAALDDHGERLTKLIGARQV